MSKVPTIPYNIDSAGQRATIPAPGGAQAFDRRVVSLEEHFLSFYLVIVPLLGILAQWFAWKFRIPSILLLLLLGMALGVWQRPDEVIAHVTGMDAEHAPTLLFPLVSLAVAVILFEGGLTLKWNRLGDRGFIVARLIIVAAVVAWVLIAIAARWILGFSWQLATLLGAILIVTGPTVVGPLLRQIRPTQSVSTVLQWEGILIDPLGAVAAVLVFEVIAHPEVGWFASMVLMLRTLLVGAGIGLLASGFLVWILRRYWLPDFLHGAFFLVISLAAFWMSNVLAEEGGLVAVTVMGIALANQHKVDVEHVLEFKEHLRVLLISTLFIVLGSRLQLSTLQEIGMDAIPFVLVLVFLVRPVSVWLATLGSKWNWREKLFVGLVAPRGIVAASVASIFGLRLIDIAGSAPDSSAVFEQARLLAPVTFCVILGTVFLCGIGAAPLARWLKLADANPQGILFAGASYPIREIAAKVRELGFRVVLVDLNYRNIVAARMMGLEAYCMNVLSEHVQEEFDLSGIGYFIAATPSDEVNTLAAFEYIHVFTRQGVYQLAPEAKEGTRWAGVPATRKGRMLGDGELTYWRLAELFETGAKVKLVRITEAYGMGELLATHGQQTLVLMRKTAAGNLRIAAANDPLKVEPGDTVLVIAPPPVDHRLPPADEENRATSVGSSPEHAPPDVAQQATEADGSASPEQQG
ncbi:MAG: sodium:hydrogen antiporter [Pirellulaceae bacterium]|nr:MAG: sodium:hydrogen antiporter [Pirellulaceae bacterium]